jgi:hypothetical protein
MLKGLPNDIWNLILWLSDDPIVAGQFILTNRNNCSTFRNHGLFERWNGFMKDWVILFDEHDYSQNRNRRTLVSLLQTKQYRMIRYAIRSSSKKDIIRYNLGPIYVTAEYCDVETLKFIDQLLGRYICW